MQQNFRVKYFYYDYDNNVKFLLIKGQLGDEKETAVHRNAWM